ncbi:hypothetical protein D9V34_11020 [Mycetocola lacteus]|uniref:Sporulation delaying protein family toxin n=1 Tax=Mycetocola lacteus TaxID=76637 RepID=A0A3L7AP83_9MICO|nr:hypothetical protein [Mycetocola lacteus]RLP82313.1 hypothetical protein D9V34_11020 [Mycetocola lacteus]
MSIPTALSTVFTTKKSIGAIALTATLAILPAALPAQGSTAHATTSQSTGQAQATTEPASTAQTAPRATTFDDRDVVDLLAFGRGPIAEQHPELVRQLGHAAASEAPAELTDTLLADLREVDPDFTARVTRSAQAKDPYRAEAALQAFSDDVTRVAAKYSADNAAPGVASDAAVSSPRPASPYNGKVIGFTNVFVSTQVVIAAAVAASVAAVVGALAVIVYQSSGGDSDLIREGFAASLSEL